MVAFIGSTVRTSPLYSASVTRDWIFSFWEILVYIVILKLISKLARIRPCYIVAVFFFFKILVRRGSTPRRVWRAGLCEGAPSSWRSFPFCILNPSIYPLCRYDPRAPHFAFGNAKNTKKNLVALTLGQKRYSGEYPRLSRGRPGSTPRREEGYPFSGYEQSLFLSLIRQGGNEKTLASEK